jgi:endonuclease/exonuclease/phosphatase family metal-dependent hydrolase
MTYNIRLPVESDGINYWNNRRPLVASMITYHAPDIIGVQEAFRRQLDEITTDHPEYVWTGVCRNDGTTAPDPDGEFSAILYRKDRFEKLDGHTFWLSPTPEVAGSKGWDAAFPRIVTWAKFRDRQSKKIFFLFNTHFDHMGEKAREESAKLILQQIKTIAGDHPVVLMGDFNSRENSAAYQTITHGDQSLVLKDAYYTSQTPHHGPNGTFSGTFTLPGVGDNRIDFIFTSTQVSVLSHAILSDSWDGRLPSDHLPVVAEVKLSLISDR